MRYTAKINAINNAIDLDKVKQIISDTFLFAPYPCAFHLNNIALAEESTILVEFTTDLSKDSLTNLLRRKCEIDSHIKLEAVGWGWLLSKPSHDSPISSDSDPFFFFKHHPQAEIAKKYLFRQIELLRLSFVVIVAFLFLLLFFIGIAINVFSIALRVSSAPSPAGVFPPFLLVVPCLLLPILLQIGWLFPISYLDFVRCDDVGMEIKYILQKASKRLRWDDIECLEVKNRVAIIRAATFTQKIALNPLLKADYDMLISTIIARASLRYIGNNLFNPIYKGFDAQ